MALNQMLSISEGTRLRSTIGTGALLMLSSGFLFAVMDCLIKALGSQFRVWDIGFIRFTCGLALLLLVFGRLRNPFDGHNRKLLLLRGITGSMAFLSFILAIRLIPISTALVLFYAFPAFAAFFSALFFGEKLGSQVIWAVIALCGTAVFLDPDFEGGILGQIACLFGAACAGLAMATIKKARETNGPVIISIYFCLVGSIITFVPFISNPQLPGSVYEWILVVGIVATSVVAQLLMNEGFRYCNSCEGGLLLTSEVVFVAIWGLVFLHEPVTWRFWVGGTLILGSMIGLNRCIFHPEN
jgi:drug/metabolite transporter (DMT)-like permease